MAKAAELLVRIKTDVSQAKSDIDETAGAFGKLGGSLSKAFSPVVMAAGVAAIGAGLVKATMLASDLNETVSASEVIFGSASGAIQDFAKDSARTLGMTKNSAIAAANTFATFGKSAGLAGNELVGFSTDMVGLATDLASFKNTSPEQAIEAIGSALRGEAEPIRAYGILLDDATLRQEALKMGLIKTTKEALTPQQKVLAAQSAIMKQTADAQGDFERTSDGLSNQLKITTAEFGNWVTEIGTQVLPIAKRLVRFFNESVFPAIKNVGKIVSDVVKVIAAAWTGGSANLEVLDPETAGRIGDVVQAIKGLIDEWLPKLQKAFEDLRAAAEPAFKWASENLDIMGAIGVVIGTVVVLAVLALAGAMWSLAAGVIAATWPILAIIAAVALLYLGIKWLWDNVPGFRDAVTAAFTAIQENVGPIVDWLTARFAEYQRFLNEEFLPAVQALWEAFKAAMDPIVGFVQDHWDLISQIFSNALDVVTNIISNAWQIISNIWQFFLNLITGDWEGAWENIKNILSATWDIIQNVVSNALNTMMRQAELLVAFFGGLAGHLWDWLTGGLGGAVEKVEEMLNGLLDFVKSIPEKIGGALSGIWDKVPKPPSWIPGIGGQAFMAIPALAGGGIVRGPTVALLGEAGPEAVIPLDKLGPNVTINLTVPHTGLAVDSPRLQRDIVDALNRYVSRNGRARLPLTS